MVSNIDKQLRLTLLEFKNTRFLNCASVGRQPTKLKKPVWRSIVPPLLRFQLNSRQLHFEIYWRIPDDITEIHKLLTRNFDKRINLKSRRASSRFGADKSARPPTGAAVTAVPRTPMRPLTKQGLAGVRPSSRATSNFTVFFFGDYKLAAKFVKTAFKLSQRIEAAMKFCFF